MTVLLHIYLFKDYSHANNDIEDINIFLAMANKLLDVLSHQFVLDGQIIHTYASVGIAIYPNGSEDPEMLLAQADKAMYQAKKAGGNRFQLYAPGASEMH